MVFLIIVLIAVLLVFPTIRRRRLAGTRLRSPIEPGGEKPTLPAASPADQPAIRDGKATVETLMDDFAEGRISVEEYERQLDQLYKKGQT